MRSARARRPSRRRTPPPRRSRRSARRSPASPKSSATSASPCGRAEDKTAALQARAGAVDELIASGALDDVTGTRKDDISAQLDALSSENDVEMELARMRESLPAGEKKDQKSLEGEGQ